MHDKDAPMTQGQFQELRDMMRKQLNKMDDFQDKLNQVKRDVNTIARNTEHERDATGQLRKAG